MPDSQAAVRAIGVDVGGTFTDLALWDGERGMLAVFKLPSVPREPALGILGGLRTLTSREGVRPDALTFVAHGTTVATNALLEGKGARTGLVTTRGFRDLLEIARQKRPHLYDLQTDKPPALVPRFLRHEIGERLEWDGTTVEKLSADDVRRALDALRSEEVEALAVCFLYSFVDAAHERSVAAEVRARFPQWYVSLSSDVSPEFREYERLSTTVINAYLGPLVSRYLKDFGDEVVRLGVRHPPYVNQSNGGIISVAAASEQPVRTLLSGPSAGVMGAAWVSAAAGVDSIITFDMGGTSTDVARVEDGRPVIGAQRTIAGYPVRVPSLEIETVGAGGGSIAWVDSGGALRVGPQSAGASPGPACYGHGGTAPTVTDANVVLGRLSSTGLLDGRMELRGALAEEAIAGLARQLGASPVEAARGVLSVVQTNMLGAIRVVSVRKGYDPRAYTLVAFGGAGPLHAASLARDLGIERVLVPPAPGILCALGLLVAPLRLDLVRTRVALLDAMTADELARGFDDLERQASAWLDHERVPSSRRRLARAFDMRYVGQNFELTVAPTSGPSPLDATALRRAFLREHERVYGYAAPDEPVQIVALRLSAFGDREPLPVPRLAAAGTTDPKEARTGEREVYFEEARGFVATPVYRRERLRAGHRLEGPAIVEQMDSTTVIPVGHEALVDGQANLIVTTEGA
jgi:N-methylhydantoinase A